jgi:hypothetical protein
MTPFELIQQHIASIEERFTRIEGAIDQLWEQPPPEKAIDQRALLPFKQDKVKENIAYDVNQANEVRGREVFSTRALDTKGFTEHNCFVQIQVSRDTVPKPQLSRQLFTAVLEGAAGSAWSELDVQVVDSMGIPGTYTVPLLARKCLALATRFVLYAADNARYEQYLVPRQLDFVVQGMLVSGLTYF